MTRHITPSRTKQALTAHDRVGDPQRPLEEGLQERCMYSGATDASVNGYVSVLSSQRPADVLAAERLCTTHHGIVR